MASIAWVFAGASAAFAGGDSEAEWTLEQARKCWKPMTRAVQHVGVPGYQFQTGVMWDGAIVLGPLDGRNLKVMQQELAPLGKNFLHLSFGFGEPMRLVDRTGTNNPLIRRSLEGGRHPVPHVETRDGDLAWKETVFAHLLDRPADEWMDAKDNDTLVTHVVFKVKNTGHARRTGHLWMHFGDTGQVHFGYKCGQSPELGNGKIAPVIGQEISYKFEKPFGRVGDGVRFVIPQPSSGELACHEEVKEAQGIGGTPKNVLEWKVPLGPDEEAELRLLIPYGIVSQEAAEKIAALDSEKQLVEVLDFWKKLQYGPGRIRTPDPFFNDYLIAVAGQMAQQVAYRARSTKVWMYKTSPNHYEMLWPCNAAKALPAFDYRGLTELNRRVLQSFIDARTDDVGGLNRAGMGRGTVLAGEGFAAIPGFMGNFGEWTANPLLISHGLELWALASHYRITRDGKWLGSGPNSPLHAMIESFDWVAQQRKRTMREIDGKKVPYWGLLPAASAHDWLAGNTVFNDAFCIYGMTEVVRLLREIDHPRAEEMAKELCDYRQCLRDRYFEASRRARALPLADGATIPFVPRMVQELDWAKPDWTYTGYSPIRAGAFGIFDPRDELTDLALAYLETGMPKGEGAYFKSDVYQDTSNVNLADVNDPEAERHYMWRHYVEYETMWPIGGPLFLARDDLPRFFEWLFHNIGFVLHQEWRVGVESWDGVPSCAPGDGERWQIIRKMFVNEFGGYDGSRQSLWLLQAIPRSWLKPGDRSSVEAMGTAFGGTVDLNLRVAADGNSVTVKGALKKLAVKPKEIRVRLRSGDGRPLASAAVNGQAVAVQPGDVLLLPAATDGDFEIVGKF
ncbi:MAG: hypothetical protein IT426_06335 [Pirellulales bacterium]|nr:hypothetical protein [Pirellulales bacterium]